MLRGSKEPFRLREVEDRYTSYDGRSIVCGIGQSSDWLTFEQPSRSYASHHPSLDDINVDLKLIERSLHNVIHNIVDRLWVIVESRHWR